MIVLAFIFSGSDNAKIIFDVEQVARPGIMTTSSEGITDDARELAGDQDAQSFAMRIEAGRIESHVSASSHEARRGHCSLDAANWPALRRSGHRP